MRPQPELVVEEMPVDELVPYANNAKKHPQKQIDEIAESIREFGNCDPIGIWHNERGEAEIVEGHGRVLALKKLGVKTAPVISLDHLTDEQRRVYTHVHNQTTLSSGFDEAALIEDMDNLNADWEALGFGEFLPDVSDEPSEEADRESLKERFGFTPFSVIQATAADWMDRKRKWMGLGIRSEEGRDSGACYADNTIQRFKSYRGK